METVNLAPSVPTKTVTANSSAKSKTSKTTSDENNVKTGFSKFLNSKDSELNVKDSSTDVIVKETSIEDCINQLKIALNNLKANISVKDTQGKLVVKDSTDTSATEKVSTDDETSVLISLLSSLINQLNAKSQSTDVTSKSGNGELTSKVDNEANKSDSISALISELETKLSKQKQPLKVTTSIEGNKLPQNESKIIAQVNLPITLGSSTPLKKITENIVSFVKNVKEISNEIEQVLSTVKFQGTDISLKTNEVAKLQGLLKNLVQVVDTAEKQVTTKDTVVDMQTLVKSQLLLSNSSNLNASNNDTGKQANDAQYSKSDTDADKVLQKIANQDGPDKTQNFANLVARASSKNDIVPVKIADNLVITKDSLTNDVIKTVKFMNVNDIKDLTVKIAPKELGEVVIKLTQEGNVMKATITTSNKEAFQLVNSNLQEINDKISNNTTSIQSFSVDVFNGEGSLFKQGSQQNNGSGKGKNSKETSFEDENGIDAINNEDSNLNILV